MIQPNRLFPRQLIILLTLLILQFSLAQTGHAANVAAGEELFNANCARCHYMDRPFTGPALMGIDTRWSDTTNLYSWISNSTSFLATGDKYANDLYKEYSGSVMPAFPAFVDADIANILAYVKAWKPPVKVDGVGTEEEKSGVSPTILWSIIAFLLLIAGSLARVTGFLRNRVARKFGDFVPEPVAFLLRPGMKPLVGILALVLFCFVGYTTYDNAAALNRQESYMPDQPIKFSHELHAGINKINCRYCHSGAEQGKSAVIPSMNVCMNCHYTIQEGPKYGGKEISKIYKYVDFDPETLKYGDNPKPVEWTRIHNLPDHVYFNHSQHVTVGGIECQTCHGPVETMETLYQAESLSMGWCVNCHRESEINFASNDFYKSYEELHKKLSSGEIEAVHVKDIGGEECQKCHY